MSISTEDLQGLRRELDNLPPEDRQKVVDFAKYLSHRQEKSKASQPTFDWAGRLDHLNEEYTSVELEDKAQEWRTQEN